MSEERAPYTVTLDLSVPVTEAIHARPEIHWFARLMDAALDRNAHKGPWLGTPSHRLLFRLKEEVGELEAAIAALEAGRPIEGKDSIIFETLDVACLAMMVADTERHRLLAVAQRAADEAAAKIPPPPPPEGEALTVTTLLRFANGTEPGLVEGAPERTCVDEVRLAEYAEGAEVWIPTGPGHAAALAATQAVLRAQGKSLTSLESTRVDAVGAHYAVTTVEAEAP